MVTGHYCLHGPTKGLPFLWGCRNTAWSHSSDNEGVSEPQNVLTISLFIRYNAILDSWTVVAYRLSIWICPPFWGALMAHVNRFTEAFQFGIIM